MKTFAIIFSFLFSNLIFCQTEILNANANRGVGCPSGIAAGTFCLPDNQAELKVQTPPTHPTTPSRAGIRRFKAFWIMGDGNIREFEDTEDDLISREPGPYHYAREGTYQVTAHLTGKYTDKDPPPSGQRAIAVGSTPSAPTPFFPKMATGKNNGIFYNHELRKNYETAFVLAWPSALSSTRSYFFFNGKPQADGTPIATPGILRFNPESTNIPLYFKNAGITIDTIRSFPIGQMLGVIDGLSFLHGHQFQSKYSNFLFFPEENVSATKSMPAGFSEKRHFPVLWADTLATIPADSIFSFTYILTGKKPLDPNSPVFTDVNRQLDALQLDIQADQPFSLFNQKDPEYIQAIQTVNIPYLKGHDPNQLIVEKIQPATEAGKYRVTFLLEMCNKGGANVLEETVMVRDASGKFTDFRIVEEPTFSPITVAGYPFSFKLGKIIPGIPQNPEDYHEECVQVRFTAITDCDGIRSLWKTKGGEAVEACVIFKDAIVQTPECHFNFPIDSTEFTDANGACYCCIPADTDFCPIWVWVLLFLLILLIFWWYFKKNVLS